MENGDTGRDALKARLSVSDILARDGTANGDNPNRTGWSNPVPIRTAKG